MTLPPQPSSPDDDTTPYPSTAPVDIQPLVGGFSVDLMDQGLAMACGAIAGVSIFGIEPFAFMNSFATNLVDQGTTAYNNGITAITGISTISNGITSNVTGATTSSSTTAVGPAVGILNTTVQISGQAVNVVVFNTGGTWAMPAGAKSIDVYLIGGGGGGGDGTPPTGSALGGGAGGGGGFTKWTFPASAVASTVTVTLGAAGVGGTANGVAGTAGGNTLFGSYLTAGGGGGGTAGGVAGGGIVNGAKGYGTESYVDVTGGAGSAGTGAGVAGNAGQFSAGGLAGSGPAPGGNGGAGSSPSGSVYSAGSAGGGGGGGGNAGNGGVGGAGGFPGGGGGGGGGYNTLGTSGHGGNGAGGQCVVFTHFS